MISITIFINGTPIETVKAVNCGLVSLEQVPKDVDHDAPYCRYDVMDDKNKFIGTFDHDRNAGAVKCAELMLKAAQEKLRHG